MKLCNNYVLNPPDTWFEILALEVWDQALYLSVTEAPNNTKWKVNCKTSSVRPKLSMTGYAHEYLWVFCISRCRLKTFKYILFIMSQHLY